MERSFNLLDYSIAFSSPRRLTNVTSWHLHIPFAFVIVTMLKPKTIVELGTHKGDSYCAFCQAVEALSLPTTCYAVDTWKGDEQAGFYGAEVLEELRAYHDPLYGGFSTLMQCLFDDALPYFPDESIDLLHIDGHHNYDSVRRDFESWLPKMSKRGIILFHDTNVREREFGVWRLWDSLSPQYPSAEFKFGNGLGLLAVGEQMADEVRAFLEYEKAHQPVVARFFYNLGTNIELEQQKINLIEELNQVTEELNRRSEALDQIREIRAELDKVVEETTLKYRQEQEQVMRLREDVRAKDAYIEEIHAGFGWRLLTGYRNRINRYFPPGSIRYKAYVKVRILLGNVGSEGLLALPAKGVRFLREVKASSNIKRETFMVPGISDKEIPLLKETVSVVIPTRNAGTDFIQVLQAVERQKGIAPVEIVIVDSASEDDTVRIAERYGARVFSIDPAEFGHGRTRNFGAQQTTGEYIVFLSQDAIPAGDFCFRDMILGMKEDEKIAAISARQIPRSDADLYACWEMWNHYEKFMGYSGDQVLSVAKGAFDSLGPSDKRRIAQIDNVFSCVRRGVFLEALFKDIPYAEDLDLGLRLIKNGYKLGFSSSIAAIHSHSRDAMYYFKRSCTDRRALVSLVGYEPMDWEKLGLDSLSSMAAYLRSAWCRLSDTIDDFVLVLQEKGINELYLEHFKKSLQVSKENGKTETGGQLLPAIQEISDLAGAGGVRVNVPIDIITQQLLDIVESFGEFIRIYAESRKTPDDIAGALRKQAAVVLGANLGDFAAYGEARGRTTDLALIDRVIGRSV